jgi:vacuolar protein sorting-associated protein 45
VVFILDGATYEEARFVNYMNEIYPSVKVVLGSNFVHNSRSYIAEVFSEWRWSRVQSAATE